MWKRATGEWGEGWNFRTRFSSVSTAVRTLFLPRANSFSFTTSSLKTSQNVARPVKQNALPFWGRRFQDKRPPKPKPAPHVPSVGRTPPFLSSQRRDGRFSAANVFSRSGNRQQPPEFLRVRQSAGRPGESPPAESIPGRLTIPLFSWRFPPKICGLYEAGSLRWGGSVPARLANSVSSCCTSCRVPIGLTSNDSELSSRQLSSAGG